MPSTAAGESPKWGGISALWLLLFLLVCYVLSPFPVIKLFNNRPPQALVYIYYPLDYLYRHVPAVHAFYDWYGKVCGVKP